MATDSLISVKAAADILECSPPTVVSLIKKERLIAVAIGKGTSRTHWRVAESSVREHKRLREKTRAVRKRTAPKCAPVQGDMFPGEKAQATLDKILEEQKAINLFLSRLAPAPEAIESELFPSNVMQVCIYVDGDVAGEKIERWYRAGELHRCDDKPAFIRTAPDGEKVERWYRHGKLHRCDGKPAVLRTAPDGESVVRYYENGDLHRPASEGPAYVHFYASGAKLVEYYENDRLHRPASDGPASVHTSTDGAKVVRYYENGDLHRPASEGPAHARIFPDGYEAAHFWENGEMVTPNGS